MSKQRKSKQFEMLERSEKFSTRILYCLINNGTTLLKLTGQLTLPNIWGGAQCPPIMRLSVTSR